MSKHERKVKTSVIKKSGCIIITLLPLILSCVKKPAHNTNKTANQEVIQLLENLDTTRSLVNKLELAHSAMAQSRSIKNDSLEAECLFKVGTIHLMQQNNDSAQYYLSKAKKDFHLLKNSDGFIKVNGALINYNSSLAKYGKVTQLIIDTDDFIAKERKPSEAYIFYYLQKVFFYYQIGLQDSTLAIANFADSLSKTIPSKKYQPQLKSVIGVVYANLEKDTLAIQTYKDVLKEYKPFEKDRGTILTNLGNAYARIGNLDSSLHYFAQALNLYEETKASESLINKLKMDMSYALSGLDLTISRTYYNQVDSAMLSVKDQFYHRYLKSTFASSSAGKTKALLEALAFIHSQNLTAPTYESMCQLALYNHYSDIGNYKEALASFERYSALNTKMNAEETFFKLEKIELINNVKEKERKIRTQKELIVEKNRLIVAQDLKIYLFVAMAALTLIVLFLLRKNYKKRMKITALKLLQTKLSQELLMKEMDPISLQLGSATETIELAKTQLSNVKEGEEKNQLHEVKRTLNEWIVNFQDKSSTVAAHQLIESGFLTKLEKFHELTDSEKKVIILIRQGYKSKEISDRLNLAVNTVEIYRSRIRTKLNIPQSEQLQDAINTL